MAGTASVPTTFKFKVHRRRITRKVQRANAVAMRALSVEMNTALQAKLSTTGPPGKSVNDPPRQKTGDLRRSTFVKFDGKNTIKLTTLLYGLFQDSGFIHAHSGRLVRHKWFQTVVLDRKQFWNNRYKTLLKQGAK